MSISKALGLPAIGCAALLASLAAGACDLKVESAWIRSAPASATTLAAYAVLSNTGTSLLKITSTTAPSMQMAMLHESSIVNGVAQMRMLDSLSIPAGAKLELAPGGKHIMLMGMKGVPKAGDHVTIIFTDSLGCATSAEFSVQANAP
ncbi:MAG: copper chaperone PCu(A)C [Steroidobacteraceae bacterium]